MNAVDEAVKNTIADMSASYPDHDIHLVALRLTGPEWRTFLQFIGERSDFKFTDDQDWRIAGNSSEIAKRIVKSKTDWGRCVSVVMTGHAFTLVKTFVSGMPPLATSSDRIAVIDDCRMRRRAPWWPRP